MAGVIKNVLKLNFKFLHPNQRQSNLNMPTTTFKPEEVAIIKAFLEDFRNASKSQKTDKVKEAARALLKSMPHLNKSKTKEVCKVCREALFALWP